MDAIRKADKALSLYGDIKRAGIRGEKETREFVSRIGKAISLLSLDEQYTVRRIYIEGLTNEEAAEADGCDTSTVSRRKKRALSRVAMILYTDQYIRDGGF